jgi:DMSO/TMAO reductase YedYZ molybdopterin-dependent catalytic subunit
MPIRKINSRVSQFPEGYREVVSEPEEQAEWVPHFDPEQWSLALFPVPFVSTIQQWSWDEILRKPKVTVLADMIVDDQTIRRNNLWEGVSTRELLRGIEINPEARFVMVHAEHGISVCLSAEDFFADQTLLAYRLNGETLTTSLGGPLRLVVPHRSISDHLKWVRGIELMSEYRSGLGRVK